MPSVLDLSFAIRDKKGANVISHALVEMSAIGGQGLQQTREDRC